MPLALLPPVLYAAHRQLAGLRHLAARVACVPLQHCHAVRGRDGTQRLRRLVAHHRVLPRVTKLCDERVHGSWRLA
jgi:hypothetical protein